MAGDSRQEGGVSRVGKLGQACGEGSGEVDQGEQPPGDRNEEKQRRRYGSKNVCCYENPNWMEAVDDDPGEGAEEYPGNRIQGDEHAAGHHQSRLLVDVER